MDTLIGDLRYGLRVLAKSPGFTLVAVLTLALGIGANTAIFSIVNAVLLRPPPYARPDRLAMVWETFPRDGETTIPVAPANYLDWKARTDLFEDVGTSRDSVYAVTGSGEPESIVGYRFSENFFRVMGVAPLLGRTFLAEEDRPGAGRVVVLGHGLWQRRFGGDPGVIGRAVTLNGESHTVVGVMPPGFDHPAGAQLWTPLALHPELIGRRDLRFLRLVARLKEGVTLHRAQAELDAVARSLQEEHPETNAGRGVNVVPLREMQVGDVQPALLVLLGAVGLVLLIAAANVSNLLLARAASRGREMAIRMALGARRRRLVRSLVTESALLGVIGGALGLLLAAWGTGGMLSLIPRGIANLNIPQIDRIPLDARVLGFTFGVSALTGVLFGIAPALRATRAGLNETLKESSASVSQGARGRRLGSALVVCETAMALVLLIGAALLLETFLRLRRVELGIDPRQVTTAQVFLPGRKYDDAGKLRSFVEAALARIATLPGVRAAGATNYLPLSGFWGTVSFTVQGLAPPAPGQEPAADDRRATPGYFDAMGIRLVRGRLFTEADRDGSLPVAVVNETLALRIRPPADPIGARLNLGSDEEPSWWEVVGVVGDVKAFGAGTQPHAELYRPLAQAPFPLIAFVAKTARPPGAVAQELRAAVWQVDADQPVSNLTSLEHLAFESLATRRMSAVLIAVFAASALTLAALGIYGVMAYAMAQRTREIGIRMALGAGRPALLRMVVAQGLKLVLAGVAAGLAAAYGLTRLLEGLLYGVTPTQPSAFLCVPLLLTAVALLACIVPALRAMRVNPMIALRSQ